MGTPTCLPCCRPISRLTTSSRGTTAVRSNLIAALIGMLCVVGCGGGSSLSPGGGGTPTGSNVQPVTVDPGPPVIANSSTPAVNTLYTSVIVCVAGTSTSHTT